MIMVLIYRNCDSFYDFAEISKIVEAGAANNHVKDYELIKYVYWRVFRVCQ